MPFFRQFHGTSKLTFLYATLNHYCFTFYNRRHIVRKKQEKKTFCKMFFFKRSKKDSFITQRVSVQVSSIYHVSTFEFLLHCLLHSQRKVRLHITPTHGQQPDVCDVIFSQLIQNLFWAAGIPMIFHVYFSQMTKKDLRQILKVLRD